MSGNEEFENFYWENSVHLAEEYQEIEPASYEDFADMYPQWKEFKTNTTELLEAYLKFLESNDEWREKFDQWCVDEFHERCCRKDEYDGA